MHQHPRPSPKSASPANSPRTNPTRTNNPRESSAGGARLETERIPLEEHGFNEGESADVVAQGQEKSGPDKEQLAKLSQVIQVRQLSVLSRELKQWLILGIEDRITLLKPL